MIERIRKALAGYAPQRLPLYPSHPGLRPFPGQGLVPAAVLVPIHENADIPHLIFIKRTEDVEHHKGQISFPGGAFDAADRDLLATALRESQEEIGLDPADVRVLGQLDDHITITNFLVTPFVGLVRRWPYPFVPSQREVAAILEVPLAHLLDGANLRWEKRRRNGQELLLPAYQWGEEVIWGATAHILRGLLGLLADKES